MPANWCKTCNGCGYVGWIPRWGWLIEIVEETCFERFIARNCPTCDGKKFAAGPPPPLPGAATSPPPPPKR